MTVSNSSGYSRQSLSKLVSVLFVSAVTRLTVAQIDKTLQKVVTTCIAEICTKHSFVFLPSQERQSQEQKTCSLWPPQKHKQQQHVSHHGHVFIINSTFWSASVSAFGQRNKCSMVGYESSSFPQINTQCHILIYSLFGAALICLHNHTNTEHHKAPHWQRMWQTWHIDSDLLNLDLFISDRKINFSMGEVMSRCTRPHPHRGSGRTLLAFLWPEAQAAVYTVFAPVNHIVKVSCPLHDDCVTAVNSDITWHCCCWSYFAFAIYLQHAYVAGWRGIFSTGMIDGSIFFFNKTILKCTEQTEAEYLTTRI